MNHEACPELYNCPKAEMTPLIRVLLRCTAAEAIDSICASCEQARTLGQRNSDYVSPSGQKVTVVIGDGAEKKAKTTVGAN